MAINSIRAVILATALFVSFPGWAADIMYAAPLDSVESPNDSTKLYTVDLDTAAPTLVGDNATHRIRAMAVHPGTGDLWALTQLVSDSSNRLVKLDTMTGAVTDVAPLGDAFPSIAIAPDGSAFVASHRGRGFETIQDGSGGASIRSLDLSNGNNNEAFFLGGGGERAPTIAVPSADRLLRIRYDNIRSFDKADGTNATSVEFQNTLYLCFDRNGPNMVTMLAESSTLYFIEDNIDCRFGSADVATGLGSVIGDPGFNLGAIAITTVPEASLALGQFAALASMVAVRRARGRRA